jgi:hypothetical protein
MALCAATTVKAAESGDAAYRLVSFQFSGMYIWQGGGSTWTGELAWTPEYKLMNDINLRLNLGESLIKDAAGNHDALLDYELLVNYTCMANFEVEAGGGAQTWVNSGTYGAISAGLGYRSKGKIPVIDNIFATYTHVFITGSNANEVRVGVGIGL